MAEIVDPAGLLQVLHGFSPVRRVLLSTAGTLQGTLSAYFAAAVTVVVTAQSEDGASMQRDVELICADEGIVVCRASTAITVEEPAIRSMIAEQRLGLGQIAALLGARTTFVLDAAGQDAVSFWRAYRLVGDGFQFRITETFANDLYPDIDEPARSATNADTPLTSG